MASNLRSRAKAKAAPILSPKASTSQGESSSPPPGDEEKTKCAICLGDLVNKSYSNSCCHQFCFGCLLEWSKVKPECPLCKSSFTTIIHNIRSDNVYDEYHVPPIMRSPPIPMLSVPYFHHLGIQDDIMALRSHRFHPYGPPSVPAGLAPNWYHRDRAHHMNFRILEYVSIDRRSEYVNPFRNGQTEFFGTSINLHNDPLSSPISNYQARRRIYDRNQWVEPLRGTFQEGSVVFPSVEYIRTHPTAKTRITGWLHRELTVLLGLQMSMHEMANVFDVIMRVLETYDIRSPEFRELVTSYFGDKTRHFQHEFFNFVISGMSVEEYDRNACYSNNRNHRSTDPGSTLFVPPIVTIDDSEEEDNRASSRRGENECVVIADAMPNTVGVGSSGSMRAGSYPTHSATASTSSGNVGSADMPWDLSTGNSFDAPTNNVIAERRRRYLQRHPVPSNSMERGRGVDRDENVSEDQETSWRSRRSSQAGSTSHATLLSQQCRSLEEVCDRMRSQIPEVSPRSCHDNRAPDNSWPSLLRFAEVSPPHYRQRNNDSNVTMDRVQSAPVANINLAHQEEQPSNNDDDCVLLGVHPVVKKPPLAVITISDSSDNEGENAASSSRARSDSLQRQTRNQCKNEVLENPEVQVPDVFMEMCFRDPLLPPDAGPAASNSHKNYVSVSSSSSSCSSRAPSPISSNNSLRTPTYYFEPTTYSYSTDGISSVSSSQLGLRRREAVTEAAVPSSSKRLRLLDSKKPKPSSSKHKKSTSRKKHRSTSGSRKKKRNRSPSTSSSDDRRSNRKNKTPHSSSNISSKRVSKKKKSRRIVYSSESSSEDSGSSTASCESSPSERRRRSKHKKLTGSGSASKNTDSQKSRRRHKSKKKHASSTSSRKKSHRHQSKKGGPLSREHLPSTDGSSTEDEYSHELPTLPAYSPVPPDSPELLPLGQSHLASSTDPDNGLNYHLSSPSVSGDYNLLLAPSNLESQGGIATGPDASVVCNMTEASNNATGSAEHVRPEEDNFGSDIRELGRPLGERQADSEDWDVTSPSFLLNLSMSRGTSDEFWS